MQQSFVIPAAIVIGGAIVALAVYASLRTPNTGTGDGNPTAVRPVDSTDHIFGNPDAPVKIVEYSDFDCPYCKDFHETLQKIASDYGPSGKVAWVYRENPLTQLHPNARTHAQAAECVAATAGNEAFWKFAAALFANQPTAPSRYGELAKQAGADPTAVAACIAEKTYDARIQADIDNATEAGARGTPYSVILVNGKPPVVISGAYPYDYVKQQLDAALASIGQ